MWICEMCVKCTGCTPQLIKANRLHLYTGRIVLWGNYSSRAGLSHDSTNDGSLENFSLVGIEAVQEIECFYD